MKLDFFIPRINCFSSIMRTVSALWWTVDKIATLWESTYAVLWCCKMKVLPTAVNFLSSIRKFYQINYMYIINYTYIRINSNKVSFVLLKDKYIMKERTSRHKTDILKKTHIRFWYSASLGFMKWKKKEIKNISLIQQEANLE